MSTIQAVTVNPEAPGRLAISAVPTPEPAPSEMLVRVHAISLNLGEVRRILAADRGWRPGWDIAGVVERAAQDGSGPPEGTRVVGLLDGAAWTEIVAIPATHVAVLPDEVSFSPAATLPVAGLTALRALEHAGPLLEEAILITGASGGVGHLACQIARAAGARVTGIVRSEARRVEAANAGAHQVVLGDDLEQARPFGPYLGILESIGGPSFGRLLSLLKPGGTCVMYGTTAGTDLAFDGRAFYFTGGASIYGFFLFYETEQNAPSHDLERLSRMLAEGTLRPHVTVEAPWTEIGEIAQRLSNREITGKAVLRLL
jgi:NADPH:quinone reductase